MYTWQVNRYYYEAAYMKLFYYSTVYKIALEAKLSLFLFKNKYKTFLSNYKYAFDHKEGIEIGGPTRFFLSEILPIYEWAKKIDGCNYSENTIWEGAVKSDKYIYSPNKSGVQYIMDGTNLTEIEDGKYDFLLSSHNLEHIANPLKAVEEWIRVIKSGGFLLLILPDKRYTFDHNRTFTSFQHLLSDFESNTQEDDLTHLNEILEFHDLKLDPGAGRDFNAFKKRCEDNYKMRALHHHVFSNDLLKDISTHFGLNVEFQYFVPPYHQILLVQK